MRPSRRVPDKKTELRSRLRLACRGQKPLLAALSAVAEAGSSGARQGLGLYWGMPWKLMLELANLKRTERLRNRQRLLEAREPLFGKAGGRMMNLPLEQRQFVNRVSHESHERYLFRCCYVRGVPPMSFRAYRRRWYGAQKANWRRFDVPRMMNARFRTSLNEA